MNDAEWIKFLKDAERKAGSVWVPPHIRKACNRAVATKRKTGVWAAEPPKPKPKGKKKGPRYWKRWNRRMQEVRRAA